MSDTDLVIGGSAGLQGRFVPRSAARCRITCPRSLRCRFRNAARQALVLNRQQPRRRLSWTEIRHRAREPRGNVNFAASPQPRHFDALVDRPHCEKPPRIAFLPRGRMTDPRMLFVREDPTFADLKAGPLGTAPGLPRDASLWRPLDPQEIIVASHARLSVGSSNSPRDNSDCTGRSSRLRRGGTVAMTHATCQQESLSCQG